MKGNEMLQGKKKKSQPKKPTWNTPAVEVKVSFKKKNKKKVG